MSSGISWIPYDLQRQNQAGKQV